MTRRTTPFFSAPVHRVLLVSGEGADAQRQDTPLSTKTAPGLGPGALVRFANRLRRGRRRRPASRLSSSRSAAAYGSLSPATTSAASSSSAAFSCTPRHCSRSAVTAIASISSRARRSRRAVELAARRQVLEVLLERRHHVVDALALAGDRLDDLRLPRALGPLGQREHRAQLAAYLVGAVAVGLVDHVEVADLEDPGLRRLDAVAHARARSAPAWCRPSPRSRPRSVPRRRSRSGSRRSRQPRAPAAPAAWPTTGRRGARARPSSGCRPPCRARGPASAPGRRAARRRRTARTGRPPARRPACPACAARSPGPRSWWTCRRRASR